MNVQRITLMGLGMVLLVVLLTLAGCNLAPGTYRSARLPGESWRME